MIIKFILIFIFFLILFNVLPKYPYIYVIRGSNLITKESRYEEGLSIFAKAMKSSKVDYMTKIRYSFLELKFGDVQKSKYQLMLILNDMKAPKNIKYEAKCIYSLVLFYEGDWEEAREYMTEVYENYKTTNVYCTLGYLYNELSSPEEALKFNLEAYEYNKDKEVISDNLGEAYLRCNRPEDAKKIYDDLLKKEPGFPEAYYNAGRTEELLGNKKGATKLYEKALTKPFNRLTTIKKEDIINHINTTAKGKEK